MLWIEGRVTLIDGILATAVLADLVLNAALGGVSRGADEAIACTEGDAMGSTLADSHPRPGSLHTVTLVSRSS